MAWLHSGVRLLTDRTSDGVQLAEAGDSDILVGARTFSANYVQSVRPFNAREAASGLFRSLEENVTPIPSWAGEVTLVLCCSSSSSSVSEVPATTSTDPLDTVLPAANVAAGPSMKETMVTYLESSLVALSLVAGAEMSTLYYRFDDGTEVEGPNPQMVARNISVSTVFTIPRKQNMCTVKFGLGPQLWTVIITPSLFHRAALLQPLLCSKNAVLAVHSFFTAEMTEEQVVLELKALAGLHAAADRYSQLRGQPLDHHVVPEAVDAVALLSELASAYAPHSALLKNAVEVVRMASVDAPLEWEEEREVLEEELSVLEELRIENNAKIVSKDEQITFLETEVERLALSHRELNDTSLAQREHLTMRCSALNTEMVQYREQAAKAALESEGWQLQLSVAQEATARAELEVHQLTSLAASVQEDESRHLRAELARMVEKLVEVEVTVAEEVKRVEGLKLDHEVKEYQTMVQREKLEIMKMVGEFQRKEFKWQALLVEARDSKSQMLGEITRLKERTDLQTQSFAVAKKALAEKQQDDDEAFHQALTAVREMSPNRHSRSNVNSGHISRSPMRGSSLGPSHLQESSSPVLLLQNHDSPKQPSMRLLPPRSYDNNNNYDSSHDDYDNAGVGGNKSRGSLEQRSSQHILEQYATLAGDGVREMDI